ncbi:DUF7673 family protein [Vreelandella neptunia]|uniref:DUF7673 family protein n=1 Tax=Vreelandella neptunia TaxID=115551 RepID=UPI003159DE24
MTTNHSMPLVTQRLRERNRRSLEAMLAVEANANHYRDQIAKSGLPALKRLVDVAQGNSHQPQHCRRVLLAVYNSYAWPLNLTSLRVLDDDLRRAALAVIEWSAVSDRELHEYLPDGHELMQRFAAIEKEEQ